MNIQYIEKNTDMKVEYHETITSTSEMAKEIAEEKLRNCNVAKEKTVIISENQTHGKGTKERVWYSSYGDNILMTLVFYPRNSIQELQHLTYDIAKMIQSAIKDLYNILLDIKLPNDLMLNGKKICGILTESSIQGDKLKYLLIGIGFNVNQLEFPEEVKGIATSLKKAFPEVEFDREEIIVKVINNIKSLISF